MLDVNTYIEGGKTNRERIAMDVRDGILTDADITELVSDERVSSVFIGNAFPDKCPSSHWDEKYLEELSYAVTDEAFNEDYLRYLFEVSEFVRKKSRKIKTSIVIGVIIVALAAVAITMVIMNKNANPS